MHSNPSFKFRDAYSLNNINFWKYGHTNFDNVQYTQDADGKLVVDVNYNDYAGGTSFENPSDRYYIRGTTVPDGNGNFRTTIVKQSHQSVNPPFMMDERSGYMGHQISRNEITFTTLNEGFFTTLAGQVPRNYGGGFYSIFQTR